MPVVDGVVLIAPHPGQGVVLQNCIDPAVADEADPAATIPELDFLNPSNGYRDGPGGSSYAADFVSRYRRAQVQRVERLDAKAHAMIEERLAARRRYKASGTLADRVAGALSPAMTVWRTDADLRCWDLSLDPSDRAIGSVWSRDPFTTNYGIVGFARFCTPEAWLSTWSGLTSRANLQRTAASIHQPCLFIEFTGDSVVFPADAERVYSAIPRADKQRLRIRGDHHGQPLQPGEPSGRPIAGQAIRDWARAAFRLSSARLGLDRSAGFVGLAHERSHLRVEVRGVGELHEVTGGANDDVAAVHQLGQHVTGRVEGWIPAAGDDQHRDICPRHRLDGLVEVAERRHPALQQRAADPGCLGRIVAEHGRGRCRPWHCRACWRSARRSRPVSGRPS